MQSNLQEYYTAAGGGKSTRFIPSQMYFNTNTCDKFIIIGKLTEEEWKSSFHGFAKKMSKTPFLYSLLDPLSKVEISAVDIPMIEQSEESVALFRENFMKAVKTAEKDGGTNLVIDEATMVYNLIPDLMNILRSYQIRQITLVSQINLVEYQKYRAEVKQA